MKTAVDQREVEQQRRMALEQALSGPLALGRVTLRDGRIGISGSVLFLLNSDQLQPEGRALLRSLVGPLRVYLGDREELLMVSGFTEISGQLVIYGSARTRYRPLYRSARSA